MYAAWLEEHAVSSSATGSLPLTPLRFLLAALAAVSVALVAFFLPETSHGPLPHEKICKERGKKFVPYIFNPLTSLGLLRWPNIRFIVSCTHRMKLTAVSGFKLHHVSALHPSCESYKHLTSDFQVPLGTVFVSDFHSLAGLTSAGAAV